jgi:hypothetical protein
MKAVNESPYMMHSDSELEMLQNDVERRQRYTESHTSCIVPNLRTVDKIIGETAHLLEPPDVDYANKFFPGIGMDWRLVAPTSTLHFYQLRSFAQSWEPILERWESGDFSHLQPRIPNPMILVNLMLNFMNKAAGDAEEELVGFAKFSGGFDMSIWSQQNEDPAGSAT